MTDLSPALPQELERDIFELAAYIDPPSVPTMMLVAHRVKIWVKTLRFRVVMLYGSSWIGTKSNYPFGDDDKFSRLLAIPPATLRKSARHLCIHHVSLQVASYILSTCDNLQDLHLYPGDYASLLDTVGKLPLRRLHCDLHYLFSDPAHHLTHSLFSNITHLECFDRVARPPLPSYWAGLTNIPHLTHLSFYEPEFLPLVPQTLRDGASLQVLLFQINLDEEVGAGIVIPTRDPRFVQMILPMEDLEYTRDWLNGAVTGRDFWSRAEEHIRRRIVGEVTTYVMDGSIKFPVVEQ
ncbi:hypothetical protein FB45DRAFT_1060664 [Roridomyces roridus]|uniref:Uncharacterized protein n=1 Tax=Roridomyces roridus TaxID=1738132 RepID=A0AAD7BPG1_9AGAR|nr:hypothetical protein FB45DRAFT_1060664 [Roridomyces roridus]